MELKKLSPMEHKVITLCAKSYNPNEIKVILEKYHNKLWPYGEFTIYGFIKETKKKLNTKTIAETIRKAKELDLCNYDFGDFDFELALIKHKNK